MVIKNEHPVILFDGVCNLCNQSVQFVIRKDKKKQFYFASLQSEAGQALLKDSGLQGDHMSSFVLIAGGKVYTQSTGALRVLKLLGGGWKLLYAFIIVPRFIRDGVYRFISANRYRWFGKQDACMVPTPELTARFLV